MIFKATDEQAKQIMANACQHSKPMGMGYLHWKVGQVFTPEMFQISDTGDGLGLAADYVQGRMVKLTLIKKSDPDNLWEFRYGDTPNIEYQSWASKYPTYKDLALSVAGVEVME